MRSKSIRRVMGIAIAGVLLSCGEDSTGVDLPAVYAVEVSGEEFHVALSTQAQVDEFEARLAAGGETIVNGPIRPGDGGFNAPWSWHHDPDDVETADATIELCDGRPSLVEADLEYWLETVGRFCPWGGKIVRRIR
jgi:hypothetical protein